MDAHDYLASENLLQHFCDYQTDAPGQDARVNPDNLVPFWPELDDLARLHRMVRQRRVCTVLEFGVGHSTLAIADALSKNKRDYADQIEKLDIRRNNPFEVHSVDVSQHWIDVTKNRLPQELTEFVTFHHSTCRIGTMSGRICHYYDSLPNICPDLVYVDGPHPFDVQGEIDGISFQHKDRILLSADLLRLEYLLLPGTLILIDGRSANVRFLKDFFRRPFRYHHDPQGDFHSFELLEPSLGRHNKKQVEFCLGWKNGDPPV